MVFASFIRKASDVQDVRACLMAADPVVGKQIRIISKIATCSSSVATAASLTALALRRC